jgi:hypothetical protein
VSYIAQIGKRVSNHEINSYLRLQRGGTPLRKHYLDEARAKAKAKLPQANLHEEVTTMTGRTSYAKSNLSNYPKPLKGPSHAFLMNQAKQYILRRNAEGQEPADEMVNNYLRSAYPLAVALSPSALAKARHLADSEKLRNTAGLLIQAADHRGQDLTDGEVNEALLATFGQSLDEKTMARLRKGLPPTTRKALKESQSPLPVLESNCLKAVKGNLGRKMNKELQQELLGELDRIQGLDEKVISPDMDSLLQKVRERMKMENILALHFDNDGNLEMTTQHTRHVYTKLP